MYIAAADSPNAMMMNIAIASEINSPNIFRFIAVFLQAGGRGLSAFISIPWWLKRLSFRGSAIDVLELAGSLCCCVRVIRDA